MKRNAKLRNARAPPLWVRRKTRAPARLAGNDLIPNCSANAAAVREVADGARAIRGAARFRRIAA